MIETEIEDLLISHLDGLGYLRAGVLRNTRVSRESGLVDLMILPQAGPRKMVLIEVKQASASDAGSGVVGQIVMYYAAALQIGEAGLGLLREYAAAKPDQARSSSRTSLNRLAKARSQDEGWRRLQEGPKLRPGDIELFVALDGPPHVKLRDTLALLRDHHSLHIGVIEVTPSGCKVHPAAVVRYERT